MCTKICILKCYNCPNLLTDHLQSVYVYVAAHHSPLRVQLGAAKANGHADLSVAVAANRQAALTLQSAGRPSAGVKAALKTAEVQLNYAGGLSHDQNVPGCKHRLNRIPPPALRLVQAQLFFTSASLSSSFKCFQSFFLRVAVVWVVELNPI